MKKEQTSQEKLKEELIEVIRTTTAEMLNETDEKKKAALQEDITKYTTLLQVLLESETESKNTRTTDRGNWINAATGILTTTASIASSLFLASTMLKFETDGGSIFTTTGRSILSSLFKSKK